MSLFTTRVELHKSHTEEDYETLHTEMEKEGFRRTIKLDSEDITYHLPTAEYNYGKNNDDKTTTEDVLNLAKKAADRTKLKYMVLVTKVADNRRYWYNLVPVKE
jgi:hypothetical protein